MWKDSYVHNFSCVQCSRRSKQQDQVHLKHIFNSLNCVCVSMTHITFTHTERGERKTQKRTITCSECHKICRLLYFNLSLVLLSSFLPPLPSCPSALPCYIDVRPPVVSPALPGMTNCYLAPATLLSFILLRYASRLTAQHDSMGWQ